MPRAFASTRRRSSVSTFILSIASLIAAALAITISVLTWVDKRRIDRVGLHYALVAAADQMIGKDPALLRFRGIRHEDAEVKYGVTASELGYLLQAFNAGSISHLARYGDRRREKPFKEGTYWHVMLKSEATRRAFPLVQQLFDPRNPFIGRCEATIRLLSDESPPSGDAAAPASAADAAGG